MWKNDMGFMWMVALLGHFLQFFHEITLENSPQKVTRVKSRKKNEGLLISVEAKYNIRKKGAAAA